MDSRCYRSDGRTCAAGWASDYSLCGDALEGDPPDIAPVVYSRSRGPVCRFSDHHQSVFPHKHQAADVSVVVYRRKRDDRDAPYSTALNILEQEEMKI